MASKQIRIVGVGMTKMGRLGLPALDLSRMALMSALEDARMSLGDLQGLVAVPSISQPHFMQAHYFATSVGLLPLKNFVVRTIDTGGAGPISSISVAANIIRNEWADVVAVVASDAVLSLDSAEFARRADSSVEGGDLPSPRIPSGYDRLAQWHMKRYGLKREHLAMVPVIESHLAARHPLAMCRQPLTLETVLNSRQIAPVTNLLECARRADGGCAIILASARHYKRAGFGKPLDQCPVVVSTGEASGPLFPPAMEAITEDLFSCERASKMAYEAAQVGASDIDFFGLYDCFPICLIRALEATRVCKPGEGGAFIEEVHSRLVKTGSVDTSLWKVNTHGGLMCFGAPWEVPAMYNVLEAVAQLTGKAESRQLWPKPQRALVYGNGGIFSASAVAILGDGRYGV